VRKSPPLRFVRPRQRSALVKFNLGKENQGEGTDKRQSISMRDVFGEKRASWKRPTIFREKILERGEANPIGGPRKSQRREGYHKRRTTNPSISREVAFT